MIGGGAVVGGTLAVLTGGLIVPALGGLATAIGMFSLHHYKYIFYFFPINKILKFLIFSPKCIYILNKI